MQSWPMGLFTGTTPPVMQSVPSELKEQKPVQPTSRSEFPTTALTTS